MISLLREALTDHDARMVATDLLVQHGYSDDRVRRVFRPYFPVAARIAARVVHADLAARLRLVNGRSRKRRIDMSEVLAAVGEALGERGFAWRSGGWPTATSYGYSWRTTCVTAVRDDDEPSTVRVLLGCYSSRSAAWGLSGNSDRATRPETVARIHRDAAVLSREDFDAAFSLDVARCLVGSAS